jgi:hypothetical protein
MPRGANQKLTPEKLANRYRATRTLEVRFWEKVDKGGAGGCWLWTGSKDAYGYGLIGVGYRCRRAHRVVLELVGRELPKYERKNSRAPVVDHICRVTSCVNPDHLRIVPQILNCTLFAAETTPTRRNMLKTHCEVCSNPLSGKNLAIARTRRRGIPGRQRVCLTCYPHQWRFAVVPRPRPPGSIYKRTDPDYHLRPGANSPPREGDAK